MDMVNIYEYDSHAIYNAGLKDRKLYHLIVIELTYH